MNAGARTRAAGILAGYLVDLVAGDPRRGHPVAGFGSAAQALETLTYRDQRAAGVLHTAVAVGGVAVTGYASQRLMPGSVARVALMAVTTWVALGGTTLARTGEAMADLLAAGDLDGARDLLPSLCGRDPQSLDGDGLARAACESIAENTSDAEVAPLLWAAVAGVAAAPSFRRARAEATKAMVRMVTITPRLTSAGIL